MDSLALLLDIGLSAEDWRKLKSATDEHLKPANKRIFVNYERVAKAKNDITYWQEIDGGETGANFYSEVTTSENSW